MHRPVARVGLLPVRRTDGAWGGEEPYLLLPPREGRERLQGGVGRVHVPAEPGQHLVTVRTKTRPVGRAPVAAERGEAEGGLRAGGHGAGGGLRRAKFL